jgi:hypothetical protein
VEALDEGVALQADELVRARSGEVAILQTQIDMLAQRSADASQSLVSEARRVVHAAGVERSSGVDRVLDARHADAAADEALQAVIGTEVQQAVGHEAEHAGATSSLVVGRVIHRAGGSGELLACARR